MKLYLGQLIVDTFLGIGTAVIVRANNETEAEDKMSDIIEDVYNLNYELHDSPLEEVSEAELKIIEKFALADVSDLYKEVE